MNVLAWHRRPPRRWWLAGFTLIELVVVIVIIAILLGMIALGYNRFTARAYDAATAENLRGMTKSLVVDLQAREGSTYSMEGIEAVAKKVPPLVATGTPGHLTVTTGAATVSAVSVAIDPEDAGKVGLALKSPTGKCVLAKLDGVDATVSKPLDGPTCSGGTAKDAEDLDDPDADPAAPDEDELDDGFTGTLLAPQSVTATPGIPESTDATVTWDAVEGAKAYEVYLDKATEPAVTVKTTSAVLEVLSEGTHNVTVRATRGTGESLVRGPGRTSGSFTVKYLENDMIALARKLAPPEPGKTDTFLVSSSNATVEPGESGEVYRSLWWKITPSEDRSYGFYVTGTASHLRIGTAANVSAVGDVVDVAFASNFTGKGYLLRGGTTYYIRVASQTDQVKNYTLRVIGGPANDLLANAQDLAPPEPGMSTTTSTVENTYATMEPGETGSVTRSLWWKITPTRTGAYGFYASQGILNLRIGTSPSVSAPADIADLNGTSSSLTSPGYVLQGGTTYFVRVSSVDGVARPYYLRVTGAPANDNLANAAVLAPPAPGKSTTASEVTNTYATMESGESGSTTRSLWWKFTPAYTGGHAFTLDNSSLSLRVSTSPDLSKAADIADVATTTSFTSPGYLLRAGTSYYVRVASTGDFGRTFTLGVSGGPANDTIAAAEVIDPPTSGEVRVFKPDAQHAALEPGESGAGLVKSLWWKMTPTASGRYVFSTDPKNDTPWSSLRIGTSSDVATPGNVADFIGTSAFQSAYDLTAGKTYYIRVASKSTTVWRMTFTVSRAAANDNVADATVIGQIAPGGTYSVAVDSRTATMEPGERTAALWGPLTRSLWWKFTPDRTGSYSFTGSTPTGGSVGTSKQLRIGTSPDPATAGEVYESTLQGRSFMLQGGVTYYIRVADHGTGTETYDEFRFVMTAGPANAVIANAVVVDPPAPGESRTYKASVTAVAAEPGVTYPTVWWKMTPPSDGSYSIGLSLVGGDSGYVRVGTSSNPAGTSEVYDRGSGGTFALKGGTTYYIGYYYGKTDRTLTITGK